MKNQTVTGKHFAIRKIKNGKVKIGNIIFAPKIIGTEIPYDGRFDGQWWAFGRYWTGDKPYKNRNNKAILEMWGPEEMYRAANSDEELYESLWPGPNCWDGTFHWMFWEEV